ncbi:MAG: hypothetical protein EZS28_052196 [Streblomastix strix]|uniref:Uncharacterized protein n=1 Tax=Streblomastix strix TaxID=222440 RepID=A0A5J4SI68_9EUKA|nr:MAG: hypothetical protein EZS28_052196 [Streblomastix strix]
MGKGCCAIAISFLHKAMLLPDEFRGAMIEILKRNHSDIISGNFATVLNKCISDTDTYTYDHGLILALNLLRFGSEDVQQKVKEGVPIERVRNLMTNLDDKIQLTAELLNQRIIAIS